MKVNNNQFPYYAIETICNGKRFIIRQVIANGATNPVNGKSYKTSEKALQIASEMGIPIAGIGDHYEVCFG